MKKLIGVTGAAFLLASCAPLMQGAFQISYSVNGSTPTVCGSGPDTGVTCFAAATPIGGGVTLTQLTGTSNSPGSASLARQAGSVVEIDTGATGATLDIWLAAQDFTSPTTPPAINYESSLTLIPTTGTGNVSLTSCVDTSNGTAPPTTAFCSAPAATLSNGPLTYVDATAVSNNSFGSINTLTGTYSLSQEIVLSLGANTILQVQTRQLLTPVPEPASLALFGSGLLGAGLLFRRKIQSKRS